MRGVEIADPVGWSLRRKTRARHGEKRRVLGGGGKKVLQGPDVVLQRAVVSTLLINAPRQVAHAVRPSQAKGRRQSPSKRSLNYVQEIDKITS